MTRSWKRESGCASEASAGVKEAAESRVLPLRLTEEEAAGN